MGNSRKMAELLAPAGSFECALAAFKYGADAIYLGLKDFSARATAENFSYEQLSDILGYAKRLSPPRKVYVTANTILLDRELPLLIETLGKLDELGVDGIIVQDFAIVYLVQKYFPNLELHASTQMAIHNFAGAVFAKKMGFKRIITARELTLAEIKKIATIKNLELEIFIHGALCYAYSGLCFLSSHLYGKSGNRGRCLYPCRDRAKIAGNNSFKSIFPFSMKDLALSDYVNEFNNSGVTSLKIEGRKKSPLYVSAVTDYYKKLLLGEFNKQTLRETEQQLKTIFSRPWSELYIKSQQNKNVIDPEYVGHRGLAIAQVEKYLPARKNSEADKIVFKNDVSPLERYDGLQIDIPGQDKPFGFSLEDLRIVDGKSVDGKSVFEAPVGNTISVALPTGHPRIPKHAQIYCSSSQAVKRSYSWQNIRPNEFKIRFKTNFVITISKDRCKIVATLDIPYKIKLEKEFFAEFTPARDALKTEEGAKRAFSKLGEYPFCLNEFSFINSEKLFVPVSFFNTFRRDVVAELFVRLQEESQNRVAKIITAEKTVATITKLPDNKLKWQIKVDKVEFLKDFTLEELAEMSEIIVDISQNSIEDINSLQELLACCPIVTVRLALPIISRQWEVEKLKIKITELYATGWKNWQITNIAGWQLLDDAIADLHTLNLSTDFSIHTLNHCAVKQLQQLQISSFTCSIEDGKDNLQTILNDFSDIATLIIYQDTPLFISEACAKVHYEKCPGKERCNFKTMNIDTVVNTHFKVINRDCRSITINQKPFCIAEHIPTLLQNGLKRVRADFIWKKFSPKDVRQIWQQLKNCKKIPNTHSANFSRGLN